MSKKKSFCLIIFILIIGAIVVYKIPNNDQIVFKQTDSNLVNIGYDKETIKLINEKLTDKEIKKLNNINKIDELEMFIKEKYYLHKNLDRYISYSTANPDQNIKDVIALVNVNADKEAYKDSRPANLSKGNLILVNKYNSLSENYEPKGIFDINIKYAYENRKITNEVNEAFIEMYNAARKENIDLYITSAYRSYSYQKLLYNNYLSTYGEEYANTISAYPGYSEHQTSLALDILSPGIDMSNFEKSKAYQWLKDNSYKYGFILRYPKDKTAITGYAFESWHYRYLGKEIAKKVYEENITYDEYYAFYLDK